MLYIVPTPIGNLRDITLRAIDALKQADLIVCEDTRHSSKLLSAYEIQKPLISLHEHSGTSRVQDILKRLKEGVNIAVISDGGMPVISDPGFELIHEAIKEGIPFDVLPGPSAVLTALVGSGLACDAFSFFGFLPPKSAARKNLFAELESREETLIFYESPFRILKSLENMKEVFGDREAVVARELTKKFEEYKRGTLTEILSYFSSKKILGEFVILVAGKNRKSLFSVASK